MSRLTITTLEQLGALNDDEVIAGYRSGRAGDGEPGDNHSFAYWHGWRNGVADRNGNPDEAQRQLARAYLADQRSRA